MQRLAWLTDVHLNFADPEAVEQFLAHLQASDVEGAIVTGDIAESHSLISYLEQLDEAFGRPLFFVLGNHDYYFSSIRQVREQVAALCRKRPRLCYLTQSSTVALNSKVGLVGHDGWADARIGDYERSFVMMNDYKLIEELARFGKRERLPLLHELGDQAAAHVREHLPAALEQFQHVYLATHVPPLRDACWYEGRISDDEWAPHFTCQAMGQAILEVMKDFPQGALTVFCGHTHGEGCTHPLPNVTIHTGSAHYGKPAITRILELGS